MDGIAIWMTLFRPISKANEKKPEDLLPLLIADYHNFGPNSTAATEKRIQK